MTVGVSTYLHVVSFLLKGKAGLCYLFFLQALFNDSVKMKPTGKNRSTGRNTCSSLTFNISPTQTFDRSTATSRASSP